MRNVFYILVALTFSAVACPAQQPNPNEILTKVASTYASLSNLLRRGFDQMGGGGFGNGYFRTTFVRPDHFAFELWFSREDKDQGRGWVVWKDGDSVKSWLPSNFRPGVTMRRERHSIALLTVWHSPSAGAFADRAAATYFLACSA